MKRLTEKELKENIGKVITVVELVLNDENETSTNDFYLCETLEEAYEKSQEYNMRNYDKNYKYIVVQYKVNEDLSLEV